MTVSPVTPPFGPALRNWRTANGIGQAELARQLGLTPSAVNRWEYGDRMPSLKHRTRLTGIMGVQPDKQKFSTLLRTMRQQQNRTVINVAVRLGIDPSTVYRWESTSPRTHRTPRYGDILALCRVLRATQDEQVALVTAAGYNNWEVVA